VKTSLRARSNSLHRRPRPVDHLVVSTLRTPSSWQNPAEQYVQPGAVGVGQLGEVADAHHQFGVREAAARLDVAPERRGEPEPDRLQDRVEPVLHPGRAQHIDGAGEAVEVGRRVRDRDHLDAGAKLVPAAGVFDVGAVHAEYQFRTGGERGGHLVRVEAVDRDAKAVGFQRADRLADPGPRRARVTPEVDDVGPAGAVAAGLDQITSSDFRGAWLTSARISMSNRP
jgi:hypothetical protein